ncbi:11240_t:CDS:1 [Acaulospora colombiana]|uniref:11240_t:CDS:1 n=1 Tax=Acaulospora colombiana TaxID=27376 RepID=A0ACA9JWM0_9GLOM|nr:11240_t:CDS:1 [Acaulospora colombiana]
MDELLDLSIDATKEMFDSLNNDFDVIDVMDEDDGKSSITTIEITIVGGGPPVEQEEPDDYFDQDVGIDDDSAIATLPFGFSFGDRPALYDDITMQQNPPSDKRNSLIVTVSILFVILMAFSAAIPFFVKLFRCRKEPKNYEYLIVHASDEDQVTDLERATHDKK